MNYLKAILLMALLCSPLAAQAQQAEKPAKPRYISIPPADVLLTVGSQPDCPIQFENARLLYDQESKRLRYKFDARNRGSKAVAVLAIDEWFAGGTGGTIIYEWGEKGRLLMPGQVITELNIDEKQIAPLSQELRKELKLKGEMRNLVVLVVRWVIFADGSDYQGSKDSEATQKFLEKFNYADEEP
jgi:hypothetical protein